MAVELPRPFQPAETLRTVGEVAVALALASAWAGVMGPMLSRGEGYAAGVTIGIPTFVCGLIWTRFVWKRGGYKEASMPSIWLKSAMLASLASGLACSLSLVDKGSLASIFQRIAMGFVVGSTAGALFWIPSLVVTMIGLGYPLSRAARAQAEKGLGGNERAARILGVSAALVGSVGLFLAASASAIDDALSPMAAVGRVLLWAMSVGGAATGVVTAALATERTQGRRRFVDEAAAGQIVGYRVAEQLEGRVLVRVTTSGGAYRESEIEEEVYAEATDAAPERRYSASRERSST